MRWLDRVLTVIPIVLLLLTSRGALSLSPLEMEAAPHSYPLATWEVTHFLGKWVYKVRDLLPGSHREAEARRQEVQQFMALADEANRLEDELHRASASLGPAPEISALEDELYRLREEMARRGARVEEILESELSRILGEEGFASRIGMVFPPVDLAFDQPPKLLTVSPRGQIETANSILLRPQMELSQAEALEERIVEGWDLSALVEDTGGVSFYPSVMNNTYGLRGTLSVAAHEWLHQYLFFHPLGRNYRSSSEMSTLNETVADMAGEALGDMAYEAITGEKVVKYEESPDYHPPAFDFNKEMHETRLRVDELLAEDRIEEAESYMEERRQVFVSEGYYIRKLNQAYFAFHGTYADTPASVSPIHAELERVRENTSSIGEFIQTVARFGNYDEFKAYVEALPPAPGE
jgi:uncharacterized protein YdcH (DUF465 family)